MAAQLVQILLPLYDNEGGRFPKVLYDEVARELTERFGGLTAYAQSPASGLWKESGVTRHDDIVVYEVMAEELDAQWWKDYRLRLEKLFAQDELVVRAIAMRRL